MKYRAESQNGESLDALVLAAQREDSSATEALLQRFQPLLRARMHSSWVKLRAQSPTLEWEDVEAQITEFFLRRLREFRFGEGVYFSHYIASMLELDVREWLRKQLRQSATPFSQLEIYSSNDGEENNEEWWLRDHKQNDESDAVESSLSIGDALRVLSPPQREVIELCCVRNRTESQAAEILGVSRSAVRNRLESALAKVREQFEELNEDADDEYSTSPTRTGRRTRRDDDYPHWSRNMTRDDKRPDLVGVGAGKPILLQGIFDFPATGLKTPQILSEKLRYVVPAGHIAGVRFFRAGVSCDAMVCLSTVVNGMTHRLIPIAPNSASHIAFAIVEPLVAGSEIEIHIASDAPGVAVVDVGCLLMPA